MQEGRALPLPQGFATPSLDGRVAKGVKFTVTTTCAGLPIYLLVICKIIISYKKLLLVFIKLRSRFAAFSDIFVTKEVFILLC